MFQKTERPNWLLATILLAHFALGLLYSVAVPIWEAHDETGHYPYVKYLVARRALPPIGGEISRWFDEAHQPPLYYLLGAAATFWIDTSDDLEPELNIYAFSGTGRGGFNLTVHSPAEDFPYRGTVLAIHVVRLVSVLISTLTVWVTYLVGRLLFSERVEIALGGSAINAFSPLYLFIGGVVNNDILVALFSSLAFYFLAKNILGESSTYSLLALGAFLGLGLLSKNSALALAPLIVLGLGLKAARSKSFRSFLVWNAGVFGVAGLASGWWYLRNWLLYGKVLPDRAAANPITASFSPFVSSLRTSSRLDWFATLFQNTFRTFWGSFGWGNITFWDTWIYSVLAIFCLLALVGLALYATGIPRGHRWLRLGLLILLVLFTLALPLYRAIYFQDPYLVPGRYLLPAVSAICLLLALGLAQLTPRRWSIALLALIGSALFILALIVPFRYIAPAYARPALASLDKLVIKHPLSLNFGNKMELLGYDTDKEQVRPGEEITVTLYWRAIERMKRNYTVGVHLLGRNLQDWGQFDTFPANGNFATSLWEPGDVLVDTYRVQLSPKAPVPSLGRISVGLHVYPKDESLSPSEQALTPYDRNGRPTTPIFGRYKMAPWRASAIRMENPTDYRLGDIVALRDFKVTPAAARPGDVVRVTLYWEALKKGDRDYTVFLHLGTPGKEPLAQKDHQPQGGEYPTGLWDAGEMIEDESELIVPASVSPGEYQIMAGMYLLETMQRLPAYTAEGQHLLDDLIPVAKVTIQDR